MASISMNSHTHPPASSMMSSHSVVRTKKEDVLPHKQYSLMPSSCSLTRVIILIVTLGALATSSHAALVGKTCNPIPSDPDFYSECELDDLCNEYWQSWSPAIVPEGMSPVNALRALQLRIPTLGEELLRSREKPQPIFDRIELMYLKIENTTLIDIASRSSENAKMVEKAFKATGLGSDNPRPYHYVDYYEGSLIKTDFTSFPLLNARGFDKDYGSGNAQKKINQYHELVTEKLDIGDKTLEKVKQWKLPDMNSNCLTYSRAPAYIQPFLKQPEFNLIENLFSQMENLKNRIFGK